MAAGSDETTLDLLLKKVYRESGYDFRDYKRGTIRRRLERRLYTTGTGTYRNYIRFLDTHPEEYQEFASNLTIKVSGFFRSEYTFHQLAKLVLPQLFSAPDRKNRRSLNFWSTACARGEEPYSIAMLLAEFLGEQRPGLDITIHATDISPSALHEAQAGVYSAKDMANVSDAIRKRHFSQCTQGYRVKADIRQMVKFSYFDLTSTTQSPFHNLDGIFCCNVLIYLQTQLQKRVLEMLYKALATGGYLVLGEVETPTSSLRERLECLDGKAKIYKKVEPN